MAIISPIIKAMQDAVHKASRSLIRDFGEVENLQVSQKGPGDFVSAADHKAEEILVRELQKFRPDWSFLLEESDEIKGSDEYRWIIDPLDGTKNFLHSVPSFCISVGLEQTMPNGTKELVAGVILAPVLNELFWAERGQGAYFNGRRIQVSARSVLDQLLVGTGGLGSANAHRAEAKQAVIATSEKNITLNMMGSAALMLAYVSAGKLDGFWQMGLKPWDMAAGIVLIREARGMVTDMTCRQDMLKTGGILAANGAVHPKLSDIVGPCYKK